jgi:LacI family transcriptional regulator
MRRFLDGERRCSAGVWAVALSRLYDPAIATVMRDTSLLGKSAAQRLLEQIEEPHAGSPIVLPPWFELRGSCQPHGTKRQGAGAPTG